MLYEDLHRRYGTHVAQRIRRELTPAEFASIDIENLTDWLEERAEKAHDAYGQLLNNPLLATETAHFRTGEACQRWRQAEDLAYLVVIAEDVSANARVG